ncbi:MAG: hypothetical protein R3B52_00215 [Candidatus Paceibacterota bacterium]
MSTDTRLDLGAELDRKVREKGGTRENIALVLRERPDIIDACAALIVDAARETKVKIELSIVVGEDETFDSLVAAGHYGSKGDWVTGEQFPVRPSQPGERQLVLLHFARVVSSENAIDEAAKQGLERPTYEDALRFGAQHPEVQCQFPVVFLHEPLPDAYDGPSVLCLDCRASGRDLDYRWFDGGWGCLYRFVFVRPTA